MAAAGILSNGMIVYGRVVERDIILMDLNTIVKFFKTPHFLKCFFFCTVIAHADNFEVLIS